MINKASARPTAILVAWFFVFLAGPALAATGANDSTAGRGSKNATAAPATLHKNLKHGLRHKKTYAHRKSHGIALKPTADKNEAVAEIVADAGKALPEIPPSVANANALLPAPGILGESARMMSARASDLLQAAPDNQANPVADNEIVLVAADQLNDVDRSLREVGPPPATSANPLPAPVAAVSREGSTWDQTSLIGKIFIGFGALLTMASAVRMFMA